MLRRDVLEKCDLPASTKQSEAPWYANYEIGLELERKGDYPRALSHIPYFHIARSHVRLQNWECAKNALDISQRLAEIPPGSAEMDEYLSLQRETERELAAK